MPWLKAYAGWQLYRVFWDVRSDMVHFDRFFKKYFIMMKYVETLKKIRSVLWNFPSFLWVVHSGSIHYFHSIYQPMANKNIDTDKHISWKMTNTYQQVLCHQYHQSISRPSKTQLDCLCPVIAMVTVCQQQFDKEGETRGRGN